MGQMTFALMIGCEVPAAPDGKSWSEGGEEKIGGKWVNVPGVFDDFVVGTGPEIDFDEGFETMGFYVACGASGMTDVPDLEGAIDLLTFETDKKYRRACVAARKQWKRYVAFAAKQGAKLPTEPRLYLVSTEVA